MKIKNISLKIFGFFILLILIISSCNKEPNEIGLNLQPNNEKYALNVNDTSTIVSYSLIEDSIRTDETTLSLLGSIYDPVLGKTDASFYTQFLPPSLIIASFGDQPILDSVVLSLAYDGYAGDTNTVQTLKIFEVTEDIRYDTSYYSNSLLGFDENNPIANINFKPRPTDSVLIDTIKYPAHLRVNLSNINQNFGNKILNASEDELKKNEDFIQLIKGLYFRTESVNAPRDGAILSFNLLSELSKITVYYKNSERDSSYYDFVISSDCARFNNYNHYNYADASQEFKSQVIEKDTTLGSNILYVQPLGGVKTKIKLPFIKDWGESQNIVINKAELVFHVNDEDLIANNYDPASALYLVKMDEFGQYISIIDNQEQDYYYPGGIYNSTTKEYKYTITKYFQGFLNGTQIDKNLYLIVPGAAVNPNRAIINGTTPLSPAQISEALKLELTYTKIN